MADAQKSIDGEGGGGRKRGGTPGARGRLQRVGLNEVLRLSCQS